MIPTHTIFQRFLDRLFPNFWRVRRRATPRRRVLTVACVEHLEGRTLLSAAPFVQSISRDAGTITNSDHISFTVTFSQIVNGVDPADFQVVTAGGTAINAPLVVTPISGSAYTVTVNGISGNGTVALNLVDNNSIHDVLGNALVNPNSPATFQAQQTFNTNSRPGSTSLVDIDGDGHLDAVSVNYINNTVSVLLGNTDGTFKTVHTYATGLAPRSVAAADFNDDGKLDLIVANSGGDNLSLLLGNGNGTFQSQQFLAAGSRPTALTVGDVNDDDLPDLIVANSDGNTLSVYLGNSNGTFKAPTALGTGTQPVGVTIADVNLDGRADLVVVNSLSGTAGVLLGNGDGTFQTQQTLLTGFGPRSVAVADLDADGKPDLVVTNFQNTISVLMGKGDGTFKPQATYTTGTTPFDVALVDVNGDGKLDAVVSDSSGNSLSILLGNGNGTFQGRQSFALGNAPRGVDVGDVNGDGRIDVVVGNYNSGTVSVLLSTTGGNFSGPAYTVIQVSPFIQSIVRTTPSGTTATGTSVVYTVTFSEAVTGVNASDFQVVTTGAVTTTPPITVVPLSGSVYQVTVSGISGTGTLGLNFVDDNSVRDLSRNTLIPPNPVAFQTQQTFASGNNPQVFLTDINGDGRLDLLTPNTGSNSVSIFLGNGNGTFLAPTTFATAGQPVGIGRGDFNGDGRSDLVLTYNAGTGGVLLGNGNGTFKTPLSFAAGVAPSTIAVADFNSDQKLDLAISNAGSNTVSVLLGTGNGTFLPQQTYAAGAVPLSVHVADLNGDGKADLAVANRDSNSVSVFLGNGDGTFQAQTTFAAATTPIALAVSDFNGDGIADLAVANRDGNSVAVLIGNGNGTFLPPRTIAAGATPYALEAADVNGDGKADLAVTNRIGGTVSVLLGNGDGTFLPQQTFATAAGPSAIDSGDINNDGRLDLVVGNQIANNVGMLLNSGLGSLTGPVYTVSRITPVITTNTLAISEGAAVVLTAANLNTTDADNLPAELSYTVTAGTHGQFEFVAGPGVAISSFTQGDVNAGLVRFVHDGSETAPTYTVTVNDGALTSAASTATITFTNLDDVPAVTTNVLSLNPGQAQVLTTANLNATDADNTPDELTYTVTSVAHGQFEFLATPGVAITSFTQADINAGQVRFVHNTDPAPLNYTVTVSDGTATSPPSTVTTDLPPLIATNVLSIDQGQTVVLTTANLNATDPDSPRANLVYSATQVAGGRFELAANPGVAVTTFTQTQVDAGQVRFVQTGGTAPPTYTLRVSDGTLISPASTVTIQAFNPLQGTQLVGDTLYVNGTGGSDSIQVKLKDGKIVVSPKGGVPFAFKASDVQHIVISLGDGNDKVKIDSDIRVDVLVNGGNGDDTITAGGGNAILVGGAGNDTLKGGSRGDILIGGTGSDKLTGSDGGDLLIAGSTVYDNDPAALRALQSEWIASVSYATRVNQLLTGTGPTGIRLQSGVTVFADNDPDKLTGNDGADWFLADRPNDKVKGLSGDEIFTSIDPLLDQV